MCYITHISSSTDMTRNTTPGMVLYVHLQHAFLKVFILLIYLGLFCCFFRFQFMNGSIWEFFKRL